MTTVGLPARVVRFPFPFPHETYRYSTNVEPAGTSSVTAAGSWGEHPVDVDEYYRDELAERQRILSADPSRFQALQHMDVAQWEAMVTLMQMLADSYPGRFSLVHDGDRWHWHNGELDHRRTFTYGDAGTLPAPPLRYIGSQIQEDVVLLDQREDALWGDAGLVTFAADWSLRFDVGMSFLQIHGPVPRVHSEGVIPRAQQFLMGLQAGQRYRRTNWTLTVDRRLDTATETYPDWGRDRRLVGEGPCTEVGARLYLRVEVQHLVRLGASGAIMFLIRTHLLSFEEVALVPEWAQRLHDVLVELPDDIADYKGITRTRGPGIAWLRKYAGVSV